MPTGRVSGRRDTVQVSNPEQDTMRRITIIVATFALIAAACSSDGADTGVASLTTEAAAAASSTTGPVNDEQALIAFSACMRDQGVDFPDPVVDADGYPRFEFSDPESIDRDALFEAGKECMDLIDGVVLGLPDFDTAEFNDTFLEYASCMRDHGFEDMPDRLDMASLMRGGDLPFDPTDPDFIAADDECRDIFAEFRAGFGRGD
jgi:hypothetical protein